MAPTGCRRLDELAEHGHMILFYGPAGSGKTRILLSIAKRLSLNGKKVLFIGTENMLHYAIVANNPSAYTNTVFTDTRSLEELSYIAGIAAHTGGFDAIIVDSVNAPYRAAAYMEESLILLGLTLALLRKAAEGETIVYSSAQVRAVEDGDEIRASGMSILEFWYDVILRLGRDEKGRYVEPVKPFIGEKHKAWFIIDSDDVVWLDGCG